MCFPCAGGPPSLLESDSQSRLKLLLFPPSSRLFSPLTYTMAVDTEKDLPVASPTVAPSSPSSLSNESAAPVVTLKTWIVSSVLNFDLSILDPC